MAEITQEETERYSALLRDTLALHQAGQLAEAARNYAEILGKFPNHPDVLNLLGVLLHQVGRNQDALGYLEQACRVDPGNAGFFNHLGACRRALGQIEGASDAFARARALNPQLMEAALNHASVLYQLARHGDSEQAARDALALAPGNGDVRLALAIALKSQDRHREGLEVLLEAREIGAPDERILAAIAQSFAVLGDTEAAHDAARRAILFQPQASSSYVFLDHTRRASRWARRAVLLAPADARLWMNLSSRQIILNENREASASAFRATLLSPETGTNYVNLATSAMRLFELERALRISRQGLMVAPSEHGLAICASECERSRGNIAAGFALYESRNLLAEALPRQGLPEAWDRVSPVTGPLLVCAEQGVGDEFIFLSCLPDLMETVEAVVVECDARCIPLFRRSFPEAHWIPRTLREVRPGEHVWDYEADVAAFSPTAHIMMASLPAFAGAGLGRPSTQGGYLRVDPEEAAAWRDWLSTLPPRPKVGVSWRSGVVDDLHADYYFTPEQLLEAIGPASATFISLLYADVTTEIESLRQSHDVVVHEPPGIHQRDELDRLAALISELDLVVTADTSVCAMAAACGIRTIRLEASYMLLSNGHDALFENLYPCRDTMTPFHRDTLLRRAAGKYQAWMEELNASRETRP